MGKAETPGAQVYEDYPGGDDDDDGEDEDQDYYAGCTDAHGCGVGGWL